MEPNKQLENLFEQARKASPQVGFDEVKMEFLQASSIGVKPNSGASKFITTKFWTIMITALITTITVLSFLLHNEPAPAKAPVLVERPNERALNMAAQTIQPIDLPPESIAELELVTPYTAFISNYQTPVFQNIDSSTTASHHSAVPTYSKPQKPVVEEYRFPTFTEQEIKMYNKQKALMIKQWLKRDKYQSFIPMGSYTKNNKTTSVNAFYMSPTEVTNLEYRTFMFDLLQQGRKDDYLKVKPDPSQWLKMYPKYNAPMEKMYFAHPAYNHYPVNNIPRVGAQIYCLWLTEVVNAYLKEKNKAEIAVIRIPLDTEWEHAATGHNENYKYPWGGPYTRNSKGCYLANFNPGGEQPNDDGAMHTAAVSSYSPNDYGLYCMSGNVAEMVVNSADSTIGTKGGGFLSSSEEMVINSPIQNIGVDSAQMDIGFRVVSTHLIYKPSKMKGPKKR